MALNLTIQFESSYKNFERYPENLLDSQLYVPTLRAYKKRIVSASPRLFSEDEKAVDVPFRDLDRNGNVTARKNVFTDEKLRDILGDTVKEDPMTATIVSGSYATRPDPACRFIFLWAKHSRAYLKLTRNMLMRIMSYHQVMPRYLEFLFLFGQRSVPHDLQYSGFREQTSLQSPSPAQVLPALGRSGRHYQLCYNLKSVGSSSPTTTALRNQEWSIRQAAIYHRFDVELGTTLWIITKGDLGLKEDVQDITGGDGRPEDKSFQTAEKSFRSSLAIHVLFAHWAINDWRWYIQWLEDTVDQETQDAIHGTRTDKEARKEYSPKDLQRVQVWEERANEAVTILESNASVLIAIQGYYSSLANNSKFDLKDKNKDDIETFLSQMRDLIGDCKMQSVRAKLLVEIAAQRKAVILQHLQSQASEKMETLTIMAQKEAVAMRIVTVVTLVYLPATFVSTFFSTDVVKYQNQSDGPNDPGNGGASYSSLAMNRWLQVTLPLTFVTFLFSWIAYTKAKRNIGVHVLSGGALGDMALLPVKKCLNCVA